MISLTLRPRHAVTLKLDSECAKTTLLESPSNALSLEVTRLLVLRSDAQNAAASELDNPLKTIDW